MWWFVSIDPTISFFGDGGMLENLKVRSHQFLFVTMLFRFFGFFWGGRSKNPGILCRTSKIVDGTCSYVFCLLKIGPLLYNLPPFPCKPAAGRENRATDPPTDHPRRTTPVKAFRKEIGPSHRSRPSGAFSENFLKSEEFCVANSHFLGGVSRIPDPKGTGWDWNIYLLDLPYIWVPSM